MPGLSDFNCEIVRTREESKRPEDEVDHNLPYMVRISFFIVGSFFLVLILLQYLFMIYPSVSRKHKEYYIFDIKSKFD